MKLPTVSIVISAYNRPQVLAFSIRSVLNSDFQDWELIVIGDGCRKGSGDVALSFGDPRIQFFNLPANTGSQSAPHNEGIGRAKGRYIMLLNQDDMYFPDHISKSVAFMERTGAEFAWSPQLVLQYSSRNSGPVDAERDLLRLDGAVGGGFDPRVFVISSSWIMRRETSAAVGPWLSHEETRLSPSQEWLHRAYRQGRDMRYHKYVSVLCIFSGDRKFSYVIPGSPDHERGWSWIEGGDAVRAALMNAVAVQHIDQLALHRRSQSYFMTLCEAALIRLGIHPDAAKRFFAGMGKGAWVDLHRRNAIEPPKLADGEPVELGLDAAKVFLGRGWHGGESFGRWTEDTAEIFFGIPPAQRDGRKRRLVVTGRPHRPGDNVTFQVLGGETIERRFGAKAESVILPLHGDGPFGITITVENAVSPKAISNSHDTRVLGFCVVSMRTEGLPSAE